MDLAISQNNNQNKSSENKKADFKFKLVNIEQFKSRVLECYLGQIKDCLRDIDSNDTFTDEQKYELRKKLSEVSDFIPIAIKEINADIFEKSEEKTAEAKTPVATIAIKKMESVVEPNNLFGY